MYALRNTPELATMALDNIARAGQVTRGIYQRVLPENPSKDYYYILRESGNAQPILVEYGFIDNTKDSNRLVNNITDYVEGVVKAIADYAGITYYPPGGDITETGDTYTVQRGDTLYNIARNYGLTVDELKALNNLTSNELYIGQVLQVKPIQGNTYVVQRGDTLYSIARKYSVSVNDLKEVNNLNTNILYIGQELLIPSEIVEEDTNGEEIIENDNYDTYIVKRGDSLWAISKRYDIPLNELISINNLSNNNLKIGQELLIPKQEEIIDDGYYIVESGDTLWSIAKKYNISVNDLKEVNNLSNNLLSIGQQLIIP